LKGVGQASLLLSGGQTIAMPSIVHLCDSRPPQLATSRAAGFARVRAAAAVVGTRRYGWRCIQACCYRSCLTRPRPDWSAKSPKAGALPGLLAQLPAHLPGYHNLERRRRGQRWLTAWGCSRLTGLTWPWPLLR
jgi:hypothetical protein